jgi:hypothetical protein
MEKGRPNPLRGKAGRFGPEKPRRWKKRGAGWRTAPLFAGVYGLARIVVSIVVMLHVVVNHPIAATEALTKILALVAGKVRVTEVVVTVRIGLATSVDVVACGLDAIMEATVPCVRPGPFGLNRLPGSGWGRALLRMDGERGSARQRKA